MGKVALAATNEEFCDFKNDERASDLRKCSTIDAGSVRLPAKGKLGRCNEITDDLKSLSSKL